MDDEKLTEIEKITEDAAVYTSCIAGSHAKARYDLVHKHVPYLISKLRESWAREKKYREALETSSSHKNVTVTEEGAGE